MKTDSVHCYRVCIWKTTCALYSDLPFALFSVPCKGTRRLFHMFSGLGRHPAGCPESLLWQLCNQAIGSESGVLAGARR